MRLIGIYPTNTTGKNKKEHYYGYNTNKKHNLFTI